MWWTQWDMASEDYNNILQFTEDYTGCVVDGERIARGRSWTPDCPQTSGVPQWDPAAEDEQYLWPGGEHPVTVKCMYFTALLRLSAAGVGWLRGQG